MKETNSQDAGTKKKVYSPPQVTDYGLVRDIVLGQGNDPEDSIGHLGWIVPPNS
jgi:hypothetical protein